MGASAGVFIPLYAVPWGWARYHGGMPMQPTAGAAEWAVFAFVVVAALACDLAISRRGPPTMRAAILWSAFWIGLGLLFAAYVAVRFGGEAGVLYVTAYLLEKSLSVDNLFLFVLI